MSVAALGGHRYILPSPKKTKKKQYTSLLPDFMQGAVKKKEAPQQILQRIVLPERKTTLESQIDTLPILPEKELLYESPETLAAKLNSLPESLGTHVIKDFPKTADMIPLVIEAIKNLKGNERIDISHIRNGEQLSRLAQRVDMNDMRWHGSGGASVTAAIIAALIQTDISTSTDGQTTITATKTVAANNYLQIGGVLQTPNRDFTYTSTQAILDPTRYPNGIQAGSDIVWSYYFS